MLEGDEPGEEVQGLNRDKISAGGNLSSFSSLISACVNQLLSYKTLLVHVDGMKQNCMPAMMLLRQLDSWSSL